MNIGIIGCGAVAKAHVAALQKAKQSNHLFVFDINAQNAKEFANQFEGVEPTKNLSTVVEKSDGVIITTPNNTHLSVLKGVVDVKAIPVLCEKPLASTLKDADAFKQIAPDLSHIGLNYRFNRTVVEMIRIASQKSLGESTFINIEFNKNSAITKTGIGWRDSVDQHNSGGVLGDLCSHLLDLVQFMTKSSILAKRVKLSLGTKVRQRQGVRLTQDDHCAASGPTSSNAVFRVKASKAAMKHELGLHINWVFEHGELSYSSREPDSFKLHLNSSLEVVELSIDGQKVIEDPDKEIPYWADSFYFQDKAWVDLIGDGVANDSLASLDDGVQVQRLISRGGKCLNLNLNN